MMAWDSSWPKMENQKQPCSCSSCSKGWAESVDLRMNAGRLCVYIIGACSELMDKGWASHCWVWQAPRCGLNTCILLKYGYFLFVLSLFNCRWYELFHRVYLNFDSVLTVPSVQLLWFPSKSSEKVACNSLDPAAHWSETCTLFSWWLTKRLNLSDWPLRKGCNYQCWRSKFPLWWCHMCPQGDHPDAVWSHCSFKRPTKHSAVWVGLIHSACCH